MFDPLDEMDIRRGRPNNAFGMVRNNGTRPHQGWDLWALVGTPVYAIADGFVEFVRVNSGAYGTQVCLSFEHSKGPQGLLFAFYAHLSEVSVSAHAQVDAGQILGKTGMTGNASQVPAIDDQHLHFEIRTIASPGRGLTNRLDPAEFLGYDLLTSSVAGELTCELE